MLVNLVANELVDGEISFVSLVKHGANRSPWKIIKMQDMPEGSTMSNLKDKVNSMFGKEEPQVSAFFVKTEAVTEYAPRIEAAGYTTQDTDVTNGITIFKQESFDGDADVSLVAIDENMGMAFDRVIKEFSSYPTSTDFKENIGASAFFPGLHNAMEALAESTWQALNSSVNLGEAGVSIDKNLMSFRKHVNALVKNMPQSVIKLEYEGLANGLGGTTVDTSSGDVAKDEDKDMSINEAMAGDLGGLNQSEASDLETLAKAEADKVAAVAPTAEIVFLDAEGKEISEEAFDALEKMSDMKKKGKKANKFMKDDGTFEYKDIVPEEIDPVAKASPGDPVVQSTTDTGVVSLDEGLPSGYRKEEAPRIVKALEDGEMVEKSGQWAVNDDGDELFIGWVAKQDEVVAVQAPDLAALAGPLNLIGKALNQQGTILGEIKDGLAAQATQMEALQKSNTEVIDKAEKVTLVDTGYDLDESLGLMNGHQPVKKSVETEPNVWKGLCPALDELEERFVEDGPQS